MSSYYTRSQRLPSLDIINLNSSGLNYFICLKIILLIYYVIKMKNVLFKMTLLSTFAFMSISCSKDSDDVFLSEVIVGSWFAVSSQDESNSIVYSESVSAITLTFRTDGTYKWALSYTNSSAVPITFTGTYTYNDDKNTITLNGKATVGNYVFKQNDKWTASKLSKNEMEIWEDTGVKGTGVRTMVWSKK
jgi:hypothetical protein